MAQLEASPLSRSNIRDLTNLIRKVTGLSNEQYFPVKEFLELILPRMDSDFVLEVLTKRDMGNNHGLAIPEEKIIRLREDVYDGACDGKPRDRLTVAHEIGHYFLHRKDRISFARNIPHGGKLPAYKDPEWQANAFAGELLAPPHIVRGMNHFDVMRLCGISSEAAHQQIKAASR